ncbi:MAG: TonB-dependent receptor [Fidelibacterota bacterium]
MLLFSIHAAGGTIKGRVYDKENETPIIGANVIVKGTYKGSATDLNGNFIITGLSPGDYDIEVSTIGYKVQLYTGISVDETAVVELEIPMEPTILSFGQEVVVIGKKPLLEPDLTSSLQRVSSDDIDTKIIESMDDILEQQVGVVKVDNEIHIRGGRADENLYIIDGVSTKDPLSGKNYGIFLSTDAIEELEVITGGFNAEYGQAMSGIIEVKTKEGGEEYHGSIALKSDHIFIESVQNFNTDVVEISLGGPEPFSARLLPALGLNLPGSLTFFSNAYMFISDTYLPSASELIPAEKAYQPFAQREENNWSGLLKLTWKYHNTKLSGTYKRSLQINQGYFQSIANTKVYFPYEYMYWLDHYNTMTWDGIQYNLQLTHSFNQRTFLEMDIGRVFINVHSAVQGKYFDEYDIRNDIKPIRYFSDFPDGDVSVWIRDGFYDTGDASNWHDHYSDTWTIKTELTSQVSNNHRLKTGFETEFTELQVINIDDPWLTGVQNSFGGSWDIYTVTPNAGAAYIQDKIVYSGMIVNIGLRLDYMLLDEICTELIDNQELAPHLSQHFREDFRDGTFGITGKRGKAHLSPRLGISHPLTDNDVLFFSYGHFSQRPNYEYIYAGLNKTKLGASPLLGNPDLNPTTTVAYEIGIKHKFSEDQIINITAFYKDLFDYATSERLTIQGESGQKRPFMYFNMDYARSRGLEVYLQRRFSELLSVRLNGTYSITSGKSSSPNEALDKVSVNKEKSLAETFMSWDVPLRMSADFNFYIPKDNRAKLGFLPLPRDFGIYIHWQVSSGKRYTPIIDLELEKYADAEYSALSPYWQRWDLKVTKGFSVNKLGFDLSVQIENLLDAKIARRINPVTGRAYEPGDPIPRSWYDSLTDLPPTDPSRYQEPRNVMIGVKVKF